MSKEDKLQDYMLNIVKYLKVIADKINTFPSEREMLFLRRIKDLSRSECFLEANGFLKSKYDI